MAKAIPRISSCKNIRIGSRKNARRIPFLETKMDT